MAGGPAGPREPGSGCGSRFFGRTQPFQAAARSILNSKAFFFFSPPIKTWGMLF